MDAEAPLVEIGIEDPTSTAAQFCLRAYYRELDTRFEAGFDPEASRIATADELIEPAGLLLVARLGGEPIGCGAVRFDDREPAHIKRMWVAASGRGLGLGRRILRELERRATEAGATTIRLETNRHLSEAISLYRSSGYREVPAFNQEPYAHHWFEKNLTVDVG